FSRDWSSDVCSSDLVNGSFPEKASDCDAYLSTGSSFSVYENVPWIHQLADFVRTLADQRIPYIGICFGHQMIGHALGGKVGKARSEERRRGREGRAR